ncbi:exocyst complex component EXO70H1-like [Juglans microcarpa x Juglans regia]|uniref:exocyst complex component EXO70H1-like n=1 Tax=Juglans microcarpa x Juglans regia TaxID=2249226 RepID=UPI001B7ED775|nr:exocyst complex component EXO70H1-like [Juglans microcarpa x Juglans regia]
MPMKGMRSLLFHSKTSSYSFSPNSSPSSRPSHSTRPIPRSTSVSLDSAMIDQSIEAAAALITKWNPDSSSYANVTSLFYESKVEAMQFIHRVNNLQKAMYALVSDNSSSSDKLVQAHKLMQIAMKRLQKEFYQILSMNRAHLDPESVSARSSRASARSSISDYEDDDDDVRPAGASIEEVEEVSSIAMADLRSIAECMISSGYAKECVSIYKIIRQSIVDEGIYRLGVEKLSSSQINKMDWEVLELKIKNWLDAVKISMRTLFTGERILCDHVFASSDSIRESCFTEISKQGAIILFSFPEVVAKSKKSPEKFLRVLDIYTAISENWPEIESIFSFESTASVRSQAITSLIRLGESVRAMLSDFESAIQKDSSKSLVRDGGVHSVTLHAMNYLSLLADYSNILGDIFADWPQPAKSSLPESYFDSPQSDESPVTAISMRIAWLILVLLCKLDGRAKHSKDVSLSYLFLANNIQHVVSTVRTSNLQYLLGEDWVAKHEAKLRQFAAKYERLAWGKVIASLPEKPTAEISSAEAKEIFRKFNSSFEEAYLKQGTLVVSDPNLRDEMKVSIATKLEPVYQKFYDKYRPITGRGERNARLYVRFAPEDVGNYLSGLFLGTIEPIDCGSSPSSSSHRRHE